MRAAHCYNFSRVEVSEQNVPKVGAHELLIKVHACGLCGSDIKKLEGKGLETPLVLGHEVVGTIVECGQEISEFKNGMRVVVAHHVPCFNCHYCKHENFSMCPTFKKTNLDPGGFAEFLRIPEAHVKHTTFAIPENIKDEEAIYTEPVACCLRCVKRLQLLENDTVLIIGFGSIGMLFLELFRYFKQNVLVMELDAERLSLAKELGAKTIDPKHENVRDQILDHTQQRGVDAVLFTAGHKDMLLDAETWVRDGGTLCLFSELSKQEPSPIHSQAIYRRELSLISSYSPGPNDLKEAFALIASQKLNFSAIQSNTYGLNEISEAIQDVLNRKTHKALIRP